MTEVKEIKKPYELRALEGKDLFLMLNLVKKIGVTSFADIIYSGGFQKMFSGAETDDDYIEVGKAIFAVGQLLVERIAECEQELFALLAAVSGLTIEDIEHLDLGVLIEMIFDFVKKKEFIQLFTRVVSLLNTGK